MKKVFPFLLVLLLPFVSRGGNIAAADLGYQCSGGLTYQFTITIITLGQPLPGDFARINFGDGSPEQTISSVTTTQLPDTAYYRNEWTHTYTYMSPGQYDILVKLQQRVPGILNISNSANAPLGLKGQVIADPAIIGANSSPACGDPLVKPAIHSQNNSWNLLASDPDGDSLSHTFTACMDTLGSPLAGYTYLSATLNPVTGQYDWTPPLAGHFNVSVKTEQWFHLPNGNVVYTGYTTREIEFVAVNAVGINEATAIAPGLYPNPAASGQPVTVSLAGLSRYRVMNELGQTVAEGFLAGNTMTMPELPAGVYLYALGNENEWKSTGLLTIYPPK